MKFDLADARRGEEPPREPIDLNEAHRAQEVCVVFWGLYNRVGRD